MRETDPRQEQGLERPMHNGSGLVDRIIEQERLILALEERAGVLESQNKALDAQARSLEAQVRSLDAQVRSLDAQVRSLDAQARASEIHAESAEVRARALEAEVGLWERRWEQLEGTRAWRTLMAVRRLRALFSPSGSVQQRMWMSRRRDLNGRPEAPSADETHSRERPDEQATPPPSETSSREEEDSPPALPNETDSRQRPGEQATPPPTETSSREEENSPPAPANETTGGEEVENIPEMGAADATETLQESVAKRDDQMREAPAVRRETPGSGGVLVIGDDVPSRDPASPSRSGFILEALARHGYSVTYLPMDDREAHQSATSEWQGQGVEVLHDVSAIATELREREGLYDAIVLAERYGPWVAELATISNPRAALYEAEMLDASAARLLDGHEARENRHGLEEVLSIALAGWLPAAYEQWVREAEAEADEAREQQDSAQGGPRLFSLIVRDSRQRSSDLEATLTSIAEQTYQHCEVLLLSEDDGPKAQEQERALDGLEISVTTTWQPSTVRSFADAWTQARGEFVAIVDAGDMLAPQSLRRVTVLLNDYPEADVIYGDEDAVQRPGAPRLPFFKPDWSPELLLSTNYLRGAFIRRELAGRISPTELPHDLRGEWDLMFRCVEQTGRIAHIPAVLVHRREGSAIEQANISPQVVAEHLRRCGLKEPTARREHGEVRVSWPVRREPVSIIIPTRDRVDMLRTCLRSILDRTTYRDFEVILVDTGSKEKETLAYYADVTEDARIRLVHQSGRFNYSAANNTGVKSAGGKILLFLNNDVEALDSSWLEELVQWAQRAQIGAVGGQLLYPSGRIQHAGIVVGLGLADNVFSGVPQDVRGMFGSPSWYRNYLALTGACLAMRRGVFEEVGGFDEGYELAFSDLDLCMKTVEAGYRNVYVPWARLRHHESSSRGSHTPQRDQALARNRLGSILAAGDPYFNPNLSPVSRVPRL